MGSIWSKIIQVGSYTMNYKESAQILEEIKKAKKILLNCHRGPDSDSVGSATAFQKVLEGLGKETLIICPSNILDEMKFIDGAAKIEKVDFGKFDFSSLDLFIAIDSSTWEMVTGKNDIQKPAKKLIVIDHHASNVGFGEINLIDDKATSTAELLYKIFEDWGIKLDARVAECLLTGIIGDTGAFQYQGVGKGTLEIAGQLIDLGANKDRIVQNIYRNINFKEIKLWGKIIDEMKLDEERRFVWSAISYEIFKDFGEYAYAKEDAANLFFPIVRGTDFGVIMVETKKNVLSVSLRARVNFDVSKIAKEVGGGGHKAASGAKIEGMKFNEAVEKVLEVARKYARKV